MWTPRSSVDRALVDADGGASGGSTGFALGMASMLFLPLCVAFCWFWYCAGCGHVAEKTAGTEMGRAMPDDDDGERDPLRPGGRDKRRDTPVCFRKSDWCSCARRPLVTKLSIENVASVPVSSGTSSSIVHTHRRHVLLPNTVPRRSCTRSSSAHIAVPRGSKALRRPA